MGMTPQRPGEGQVAARGVRLTVQLFLEVVPWEGAGGLRRLSCCWRCAAYALVCLLPPLLPPLFVLLALLCVRKSCCPPSFGQAKNGKTFLDLVAASWLDPVV